MFRTPRRAAVGLLLGGTIILACSTNPATGSKELMLVSEGQEIEMGKQTYAQSLSVYGSVPDSALQAYVSGIGQRLAAASERPGLPWAFAVLDDPVINAFAAPGGFVMVTRGILANINNEAELASVLGHEVGHVTARHTAQSITRQQLAQVGMAGAMLAQPGLASVIQAAGQGLGVLFLKFGRDQESQSDMLGFRYMMRTKYDPREADNVFEMFSRMEAASGGARLPDWQSTHPAPEGRVENAKARADTVSADLSTFTVGRNEFLRHIDGLIVGANPRNGYFEGDRFYQPDLAFQVDFPPGWKHQNTARSVLAAPAAGDAMIQIQFAEGSPQEAAQKFFSGQGIEGTAQNTTVNGLQATGGNFTAQTESGVLEGAVLFLAHKGRTYRLAGFAPQGKGAAYAEQIRTSLRSFKGVTDSKVLNIKPNRIKLERVPSQMTLEQFNQRFPSVVELSQLALMNGLESGASVLSAGDHVKRVMNR